MKKKILFIISNMESGGVSKSMSSLLNVVDAEKYDVDCFILSPVGVFMPSIPKNIHIISDERTALLCGRFPHNISALLKKGYVIDAVMRLLVGFFMLFNKGIGGWLLSRRIKSIDKEYDLAVDYNGQHQLYYLVDKIKAQKKVSFFHSDYAKWPYYYKMDKKYFPKVNHIFSISELCVQSLKNYFPDCINRIGLFENISSVDLIEKMSQEKITDSLDDTVLKLITIGHLCQAKGTDLALQAAVLLKKENINFKWYFIGQNQEPALYSKMINDNDLSSEIVFLGLKANPYPYIKQADIMVHASRFEGKSIALDEAKILCKPIVVTNFSTVKDQFTDGVNANVCEMHPQVIAEKIINLYRDEKKIKRYIAHLKINCKSNEAEIDKLYQIID